MGRTPWMVLMLAACSSKPIGDIELPGSGAPATTPTGLPTGSTGAGTPTGGPATDALVVDIVETPSVVELGEAARLVAEVRGGTVGSPDVEWVSDIDGVLLTGPPDGAGESELVVTTLRPGWHVIRATATDGPEVAFDEVDLGVCEWPGLEDFSSGASLTGWTLFGNAAWDPGGWLEITGNIQNSDGAIYKTDRKVNPGNVAIEFDIATGGGVNTGADGFAVNVIDAYDEVELAAIVNSAANGGCLGYGTDGVCGSDPINSFHVEFDTWYNAEQPDPTQANHVAIALNGDPLALLYAEVPSLEDLVWRHVRVEISGSTVTVFMDGSQIISGALPGFTFDGGYIGVSGSTGYASNYHRFDNLQLFDLCEVPPATP